jgi:predicted Zn-dependent peptidase
MAETFAGFEVTRHGDVPVLINRDPRFKSFRVLFQWERPFGPLAAARSLLPALLLQGTRRDADRVALVRRMELLYGASVLPGSHKLGERHVLRLGVDAIHGGFLPGAPDQLGESLALLAELATEPRLEAGAFPAATFALEQRNTLAAVRALRDDKDAWARQQAILHACAGEPFALPEHGGLEAIAALAPRDPEAARADFLAHGPLLVVASGTLPDDVTARLRGVLARLPARTPEPPGEPAAVPPRPPRATVERQPLQQSKLVLTFRAPPSRDPDVWLGRSLAASVLGGGPHSRLFRELRERRSLAYSLHAVLDRWKGLLQVHAGCDEGAAAEITAHARQELAALADGGFTDEELATARARLVSSLREVEDSLAARQEFTVRRWQLGEDLTPAQLAQRYERAGRDLVAAAVRGVWFDPSDLRAPGARVA